MSVLSFSLAPGLARVFRREHPKPTGEKTDLEALLARIRQRLYPETVSVLATYWLKTIYAGGHERGWWRDLNRQLKHALREQVFDAPAREALVEIQNWIQQSVLRTGRTLDAQPRRLQPFRPDLSPQRIAPYIVRLLNEWLPAEVARLMTSGSEPAIPEDGGISALAVGRALERLLIRENLSPGTLEMLLDPGLASAQYVYPADAEILRDVVLALLGRTWAPASPVLPATVLGMAGGTPLLADYRESVRNARYVQSQGREELHVPISAAQALEILKGDPVRINSIVVTMDGRWWQSEELQSGEQHVLVYTPGERLRIDYSADHARVTVPWPEARFRWPGTVHFQDPFELFGREWHATSWEVNGEFTSLHLEFSRALAAELPEEAEQRFRRSRPASVDMAWAALENALAAALSQKSDQPIEQLRHSELIPVGRAIFGLAESVKQHRLSNRELVETQLRAICYFQGENSRLCGRVPWRILPAPIRETFLKRRLDPALLGLLNQTFDELPAAIDAAIRRNAAGSSSPSQAA